jgi:hypothetical protein
MPEGTQESDYAELTDVLGTIAARSHLGRSA